MLRVRKREIKTMIQSLQKRLRSQEEGFTLVELLVVIVILGILAAIVVLAVGGITNKGEANAKATDRRSLEAAEEAYFAKTEGDNPVYATEANLVTFKMLREESAKHDICLNGGKTDYQIVDQGAACPAGYAK
jgi:prepilin-type N-terminal cleavage/methylation domain-containing protein